MGFPDSSVGKESACMHPNVHRSTVYHSQDMEAT